MSEQRNVISVTDCYGHTFTVVVGDAPEQVWRSAPDKDGNYVEVHIVNRCQPAETLCAYTELPIEYPDR